MTSHSSYIELSTRPKQGPFSSFNAGRRAFNVRCSIFLALLLAVTGGSSSATPSAIVKPIAISYFYQPGCKDCRVVSNEVLPELEARCDGFYSLEFRDVAVESNYLQLAQHQARLGIRENESVCMIVDGQFAL
ncbi:MAG: hypothetical protein WCN95_15645, partial [bacterium]